MCLISVAPKGTSKSIDILKSFIENGMSSNTDGSGFAYKRAGEKKITLIKGFVTVESICSAISIANLKDEDELIIHHRIGTSGNKNSINMHPFAVTQDKEMSLTTNGELKVPVMAHNGVFYKYTDRESPYNDTYHFVEKFVSNKHVLSILKETPKNFIDWFSGEIGTAKLAFLFPDRDMVLIGKFTEEDGYYHSNGGYKSYVYDRGGSSDNKSCSVSSNSNSKSKQIDLSLYQEKYHPSIGRYITPNEDDFGLPDIEFRAKFQYSSIIFRYIKLIEPIDEKKKRHNFYIDAKYVNLNKENCNHFLFMPKNSFGSIIESRVYCVPDYDPNSNINIIKQMSAPYTEYGIDIEKHIDQFSLYVKPQNQQDYRGIFNILEKVKSDGLSLSLLKKIKGFLGRSFVGEYKEFKGYGRVLWSDLNYLFKKLQEEKSKKLVEETSEVTAS